MSSTNHSRFRTERGGAIVMPNVSNLQSVFLILTGGGERGNTVW